MSKHWDYEDDHDWDDDVDYASKGYVYWYGKYYPKEDVDALFKDSPTEKENEDEASNVGWIFLLLAGIGAAGYGIHKRVLPVIKKRIDKSKHTTTK